MKLSAAHSFIRWDGRMLTPAQEQIIDALERQRCRQGRVRAVVNITPATAPDIEWLLQRYTQYLRTTFLPHSRIMVVDTTRRAATARFGGIRGVRAVRDFVHVCSGTRRYGTRGQSTFQHVLAFNMDLYGRRLPGDPRTRDVITNAISSVPDAPGTSIIFAGHYRRRSRRGFSSYYAYTAGRGPDHTYIVVDSLCPPPLRRIRAISRTEWRRLAGLPALADAGTSAEASPPPPGWQRVALSLALPLKPPRAFVV
ncbi:MAG: hypothetical protein K2F97_07355 [Muribaculaceae bacterium]|nr:hypothetical protein [Muribaculaceae bacterium]MDE6486203.1 hypothetical protein [Muribaculaceae bacterium]MDE6486971.1 hypothetical protein [Muribaculaceae bacterium]